MNSELKPEIQAVIKAVSNVSNQLDVVSSLGKGSFSTVVLIRIKQSPKQQFALKCLIPTTSSAKAASELTILRKIGGTANVINVLCAFRKDDRMFFMMDYFPHDHFTTFVHDASDQEIQDYIRNLLIALRHIHRHRIIHRDIKATNFLFNRKLRKYRLIDFGLAEEAACSTFPKQKRDLDLDSSNVENTNCAPTKKYRALPIVRCDVSKGKSLLGSVTNCIGETTHPSCAVRTVEAADITERSSCNGAIATNVHNESTSLKFDVVSMPVEKAAPLSQATTSSAQRTAKRTLFESSNANEEHPRGELQSAKKSTSCICYARPTVCKICKGRKHERANKAGTAGFRAPEILLNHVHQTTAIDVWSAGIMFLGLMTRRYPFMKPKDDETALAQLMTIFGTKAIANVARKLGKKIISHPICNSIDIRRLIDLLRCSSRSDLQSLVQLDSPNCAMCEKNFLSFVKICLCKSDQPANENEDALMGSAVGLLTRMLDVDPVSRISAQDALELPFLNYDS